MPPGGPDPGAHTHEPPARDPAGGVLALALVGALVLLVLKGGAGLVAHSLSLIGDAVHSLTDVLAYGGAVVAARAAHRAPTGDFTYGFGRGRILAALGNGVLLLVLAAMLAVAGAVAALGGHDHPRPLTMLAAGAISLVVSAVTGFLLRPDHGTGHGQGDGHGHPHGGGGEANRRAAFLHAAADVASSLGVVLAAALVALTGVGALDGLAAVAIAVGIGLSSWRIVRQTVGTLMEGTPPGIRVDEVAEALGAVDGVCGVHHLHIWQVDEGTAMSGHLVLVATTARECERAVERCGRLVHERFGIGHSTFQAETHSAGEADGDGP